MTSVKLCGGILLAIPTAIPVEPLVSKFGTLEGKTEGSINESSYVGTKLTVSFSKSASNSCAIFRIRTSV